MHIDFLEAAFFFFAPLCLLNANSHLYRNRPENIRANKLTHIYLGECRYILKFVGTSLIALNRRLKRQVTGRRPLCLQALCAMMLLSSTDAYAQSLEVDRIEILQPGEFTSPTTGESVFQLTWDDKLVRLSGAATRVNTNATRILLVFKCTGGAEGSICASPAYIDISTGSPIGRLASLTNLWIAVGTEAIGAEVVSSSDNYMQIKVAGLANGTTGSVRLTGDLRLGNSGFGLSSLTINASVQGLGARTGTYQANVIRAISMTADTGLAFGKFRRPTSGTNTITINESTGSRSLSGAGDGGLLSGATVSRSTFTISGEGAQAIATTVPGYVDMVGPGGATLRVNLTSTAPNMLSGVAGNSGSATIGVGGTVDVSASAPAGAYSGSYQVTVQYN